jgi:hypothetical protein
MFWALDASALAWSESPVAGATCGVPSSAKTRVRALETGGCSPRPVRLRVPSS